VLKNAPGKRRTRVRRLKRLVERLQELQAQKRDRDALLLKLGAAGKEGWTRLRMDRDRMATEGTGGPER
jgi:hypothetical protein